ncbi:MAG: SDH family Clp fold serine proteinase [Candidatus Binatia bacterium]
MSEPRVYSIWFTLANIARFLFWLLLVGILLAAFLGRSVDLQAGREQLLRQFQAERKSRVIAMIHRQERASVLGVPVESHIDIEDSEAILRAIRLTPSDQPIDLILHTPGGLVLAAGQIAKALAERKAKVTVLIPHYAMSGGTLIALAADEIVMDSNAVLGPVDPQIGGAPAASILRVLELKKPEDIDDTTIILADVAAKARVQVAAFVADVLSKHFPPEHAAKLATVLTEGRWTHDFSISVQMARELGFKVSTDMPLKVYQLMELYPQANAMRPSVVYVPRSSELEKPKGQAPVAPPAK